MTALREEYPQESVGVLCGLFGKRRQWYYKNSGRVVSEAQRTKLIEGHIDYYRCMMPRIGGAKLYCLLVQDLGREVTRGRDAFLKVYSSKGFRLPGAKPIHTTNSNHIHRKYPDLTVGLIVLQVNQLWVADITYIWIEGDVLYLHLVTDAYSHAVIGWCLSDNLEADNTVEALRMAVRTAGGGNLCGTTHHSDKGAQYACRMYVEELTGHHIRISMTERHDPTDNAVAERMNGILKTEWIYHQEVFKDREQAQDGIAEMIRLYNCVRPHMSIGNKTPMSVYLGEEPGPNLWKK